MKAVGDLEEKIITLRKERKLGARCIQNELIRLYSITISLAIIHKVLQRNAEKLLLRKLPFRKTIKRYQKEVPGERIQMDVCKIAPGLYQYTAIDDCTRYRVLALYNKRTAANTIKFLEKVIEEMPYEAKNFSPIKFKNCLSNGQSNFALSSQLAHISIKKLKGRSRQIYKNFIQS